MVCCGICIFHDEGKECVAHVVTHKTNDVRIDRTMGGKLQTRPSIRDKYSENDEDERTDISTW